MLDLSKDNFESFKLLIQDLLVEMLENKLTMLNPESKNILVTICYILNGLDILRNFQKWEHTGLELEHYFRSIETEDCETLLSRVLKEAQEQNISFSLEIGESKD